MNIPTKFKEYIWLVNTIRKARRITFAEINERWLETEMSGGVDLPRATFNRHKDAIQDIFGIVIECDRQDGYKYYIYNERVLREDSVQNWMLSTLSVSNIISESLSLQKRILLESANYEDDYLPKVIEAMKRNVRIAIKYRKYGDEQYYVSDLPIHHSQREIGHGDDYTDYELFLRPTPDFVRHLIGMGDQVQVLSPDWLADEVCQRHYDALCMNEPEED